MFQTGTLLGLYVGAAAFGLWTGWFWQPATRAGWFLGSIHWPTAQIRPWSQNIFKNCQNSAKNKSKSRILLMKIPTLLLEIPILVPKHFFGGFKYLYMYSKLLATKNLIFFCDPSEIWGQKTYGEAINSLTNSGVWFHKHISSILTP